MAYAPSFILGKLSFEKTSLNLDSQLKYFVIWILVQDGEKIFILVIISSSIPSHSFSQNFHHFANNGRNPPSFPFPVMAFINEKAKAFINEAAAGAIRDSRNPLSCFLFHILLFQLHYKLTDLIFPMALRF